MERATAEAVAPMNVFQRLNEVRKKVPYLQKDKEVGGKYKAVTHDAVTAGLREHLIAHGVLIVPNRLSGAVMPTGTTTAKGIPIVRYEAVYSIAFVNVDDPQDRVTVDMEAHALDEGDKAPGKAVSYATKYAMLKLFSIETGEDDEERHEAKGRKGERNADAANGQKQIISGTHTPTDGAVAGLPTERQEAVRRIASGIVEYFDAEQPQEGFKAFADVKENDERVAVWELLKPHSAIRRRIKNMGEEAKKAELKRDEATQA